LVVVDWLSVVSSDAFCSETIYSEALYSEVVCLGTFSSGTSISLEGTELLLVDVVISEFGV